MRRLSKEGSHIPSSPAAVTWYSTLQWPKSHCQSVYSLSDFLLNYLALCSAAIQLISCSPIASEFGWRSFSYSATHAWNNSPAVSPIFSTIVWHWCSGKSGIMGTLSVWRAREREPITGVWRQTAPSGVQGYSPWLGGQRGFAPLKVKGL